MNEFIDGVTLLSERTYAPNIYLLIGALIGLLLAIVIMFVLLAVLDLDFSSIESGAIVLSITLLGAFIGSEIGVTNNPQISYQVIVSSEVSLENFNEHYEILKQDGKVYTIQIKE